MRCLDPVIGRVAISKAGRDKGRLLMVVKILDEDFVLAADGDLRKLEKPKKKRIKHLRYTDFVVESIAVKIENGEKVLNSEIRDAIREIEIMLKTRKE
ncbi:MAG: RNA-binding protein [Clostridiaceae bacterium]|jgi:large subunit ribosomal protein L14e|nr:RNA-binding protein [Clostridiaceae bacterium]